MKAFLLVSRSNPSHFSNALKIKLKHNSCLFISSLGLWAHAVRNDGAPALGVIIHSEEILKCFLTVQVVAVLKEQACSLSEYELHPRIKLLNSLG